MKVHLLDAPLTLIFRPSTQMTDYQLLRLREANQILGIERDAKGWIHVKPGLENLVVGEANAELSTKLWRWANDVGGGRIVINTGFVLPDGSMSECRLAWITSDQWESIVRKQRPCFPHFCPPFVIEFVSSHGRQGDLENEMDSWVQNGTKIAWLLCIQQQKVTVYRKDCLPKVSHRPKLIRAEGSIPSLEAEFASFWG